jgi:hypothetical protein
MTPNVCRPRAVDIFVILVCNTYEFNETRTPLEDLEKRS